MREKEMVFVPGLAKQMGRKIVSTTYGLELGNIAEADADIIVILGGMAMPKIWVDTAVMRDFRSEIKYKKLVGVCFMGIFEKLGWCQSIRFDYLLNLIIEGDVSIK